MTKLRHCTVGADSAGWLGATFPATPAVPKVVPFSTAFIPTTASGETLRRSPLADGLDGDLGLAGAPGLDHACQSELVTLMGRDEVLYLMLRLGDDMQARFRSAEPTALRADAHDIVSTSGLLGFSAVSMAARELQNAIEADGDVADALSYLLTKRSEAIELILRARRLSPGGPSFRWQSRDESETCAGH